MLAPNPVCTILLCALLIYWEEEKENRSYCHMHCCGCCRLDHVIAL
ncbi:hypothetical protein WN943_000744 [Citrus x changshan-huyou]